MMYDGDPGDTLIEGYVGCDFQFAPISCDELPRFPQQGSWETPRQ